MSSIPFNPTNYGESQRKMNDQYQKTYNSFSGTDIVACISVAGLPPKVIGEIQTISYSIHREVAPVRTLGRINPVGFTGGPRTIAGSLIFTVFDKNMVYEILDLMKKANITVDGNYVMDEMPPFDIMITMQNEYGQSAKMAIKGIVISDEGQVMSIEDMITENTFSYMATDIEVLTPTSATSQTTTTSNSVKKTDGPPALPSNVKITCVGKKVTVTFKKGANVEYTFLDLWCDQMPDYQTKEEKFEFTVPDYNHEYSFLLLAQGPTPANGTPATMTKWSDVYRFRSGDIMEPPKLPGATPIRDSAIIGFTKGADANNTELQYVSFTDWSLSDFESKFAAGTGVVTLTTANNMFTLNALTPSTNYYFRMRSKKSDGQAGAWSTNGWWFKTKI